MQAALTGTPIWPSRKISVPPARALVSRARLLRPLREATGAGGVVLVVAPAGSGKTSLLADWARQASSLVAWYSLDAADRDPRRLMSGILAAVERALPGSAEVAERMLEQGAPDVAVMGMLLGALEGRPFTLVVDDFQHLDDAADTTPLWDHFFRFRPPTLSLVILSRTVPILPFTALSAADGLIGLGLADLSFDEEEAAQLLAAHGLDAATVPALVRRSGGWATGMLLLARSGPDGMRQIHPEHQALMERLGADLLAALPENLRAFLLESVVISPVSAAEADGILKRHDSAALFAEIQARGLFLHQHDGIFNYLDLFAEFVTSVLAAEAPRRLSVVRRSAVRWWASHGDLLRALSLAAQGQHWDLLADLLERSREELWVRRLWSTICDYVERLPAERRTVRLLELCGHAYCERGDFSKALALADAGTAIATSETDWLRPAFLATQTLVLAGRNEEGIERATAALEVAQSIDYTRVIARLRQWRGWARLRIGLLAEGREDLCVALDLHRQTGDVENEARTLAQLASQLTHAGQSGDVDDLLVQAGMLWKRLDRTANMAMLHDSWARLHLLRGELAQAREQATRSLELLDREAHPQSRCEATVTLAEICADAGDLAEADQLATDALELAARLDAADLLNAAMRVRIAVALARRERAVARHLIDDARMLVFTRLESALLDYLEGMHALRARAFGRAVDMLKHAARELEAVHRPQLAARAYLLLAEAAICAGAQQRAESALNRMTDIAARLDCEGYLRPPARMARQAIGDRHLLRGLRKRTLLLLDRLAAGVPALSVVRAVSEMEVRPAQPLLHLSPFGQGRIVLAERAIDGSALPSKARELLFYAASAPQPIPREELLNALWDGEERAAQNLWDASRHLRRVIGENSWRSGRGRYTLQLAVRHDAAEFDQQAAAALGKGARNERLAAAERALELVGEGGYLEWCDSPWVAAERARTMTRAMHVALTLGMFYDEMSRRDDALELYRRATSFEPFEEKPRLALLRALAAAGQIEAAVQEYNAYRHLMREELDAEPSAALRAVVAQISARK